MPSWYVTTSQRGDKRDPNLRFVLCKSIKLACPYFGLVVIVDDGVVGLEAAIVKILVHVDAGIVVVGEIWEL